MRRPPAGEAPSMRFQSGIVQNGAPGTGVELRQRHLRLHGADPARRGKPCGVRRGERLLIHNPLAIGTFHNLEPSLHRGTRGASRGSCAPHRTEIAGEQMSESMELKAGALLEHLAAALPRAEVDYERAGPQ